MRRCILFAIVSFVFLFFPLPVRASDVDVTCDPGGCTSSGAPLFHETLLAPLSSVTKTVKIQNNYAEPRVAAIEVVQSTFSDSAPSLANNIFITIRDEDGTILFGPASLGEWKNEGFLKLSAVPSGSSRIYSLSTTLNNVDNSYQGKQLSFDLTMGFDTLPGTTSTVLPGGGSGGASPPVCTDAKPDVPSGFTATLGPGTGQVTLSWTAPGPPYTYFLIAYSDSISWPPKWGNPNTGNGTLFTVSGLGGGTYWFWLRAGNGCMPGDFIGPVTTTLAGVPLGGPAVGFVSGVLGVSTPSGFFVSTPSGEVIGTAYTFPQSEAASCWWWIILSGAQLTVLSFLYYFWDGKQPRFWWIIPIALGTAAFLGDQFIAHRYVTPSLWCNYMWLWVTVASLLPSAVYWKLPQQSPISMVEYC